MQVSRLCERVADNADNAQASNTRLEAKTPAAAPLAKAIADKCFPNPVRAPSQTTHPPSAQATIFTSGPLPLAHPAQTIVDRARASSPHQGHSQLIVARPIVAHLDPTQQLANPIVARVPFPNSDGAHFHPKHPPDSVQVTQSASNAPAQVTTAGNLASYAAPQPQGTTAGTAERKPHSGITFPAPFPLSATLHPHFDKPQQAEAAQLPAEAKQPAPAQHSLLHRGASSDHRQAHAAQQTFLRGLLADPAFASDRGQTASDAALQTTTAAAATQGVLTQPPLPQQWSTATHKEWQGPPGQAYNAFVLHMSKHMHDALPLDKAIGLVFPPKALEHQLDQQFMEHARNRCLLILKAANPHAAVPYSQSSEAPNTWRAAVLGLLDWLVGVHRQGAVADDPHAKQLHSMLFCTLGKVQVSLATAPFH